MRNVDSARSSRVPPFFDLCRPPKRSLNKPHENVAFTRLALPASLLRHTVSPPPVPALICLIGYGIGWPKGTTARWRGWAVVPNDARTPQPSCPIVAQLFLSV